MDTRELPQEAQTKLYNMHRMANWFGQFFVRQAERIVNQATNDK